MPGENINIPGAGQVWNDTTLPWQNPALPWKNTAQPWNDPALPWKSGGSGISLTAAILAEGSAENTVVGALSVTGVSGSPTFSLDDDAGGRFKITGSNLLAGATPTDYEAGTSHVVTVSVSGVTPSINPTDFTVHITDVDEVAPTITSSNSHSVSENVGFSLTLTANEAVTWTKTGGADQALFTLGGSSLTMAAKDYDSPTDADTNNTYVVQVTATDAALNATNQTITVTVNNVTEDTTPDAFVFVDETNAALSTVYTSNAITVAGIDGATAITVSGGEYRKNAGSWVSTPGTVVAGDSVDVRLTTSGSYSTATNCTLDIGGVTDTYTVTTIADPGVGGDIEPFGLLFLMMKAA
jgi:hypothetical protein